MPLWSVGGQRHIFSDQNDLSDPQQEVARTFCRLGLGKVSVIGLTARVEMLNALTLRVDLQGMGFSASTVCPESAPGAAGQNSRHLLSGRKSEYPQAARRLPAYFHSAAGGSSGLKCSRSRMIACFAENRQYSLMEAAVD